jgi:uncharacterized caspase-like protein
MPFAQVGVSRRSIEVGTALVALVSLAIGAHAALNKRTDTAKPIAARVEQQRADGPDRVALVIGNGRYPDAAAPLAQPINDARAMTAALRRDGFEVDVVEDAGKDDMKRAVERLRERVKPQTVVMLYFGGYGIQAGRESYMLPVDATIWKESDVRREGVSVESVLAMMSDRGAQAKLVVLDASRRNPYERRFRGYSHGLGAINAPANALILSSATPGRVADDTKSENSVLVSELLANMSAGSASAETMFGRTRSAVSRASLGEQVPSVSSSLTGDIYLGASREARAGG